MRSAYEIWISGGEQIREVTMELLTFRFNISKLMKRITSFLMLYEFKLKKKNKESLKYPYRRSTVNIFTAGITIYDK